MQVQLTPGKEVTLSSMGGQIRRVVVHDLGDVVTITTTDEYKRAKEERREPVSVGFKKADVLKVH